MAGLSLIVAIGAQNVFVLRQGLRCEHVGAVVTVCAASDAILIVAGVAGIGELVKAFSIFLEAFRYGGALFLAICGTVAALRAWRGGNSLVVEEQKASTLTAALLACLGFTWLNPHVYLDTMILLGSIANTYPVPGSWIFASGAASGSVLWFASLGYGARLLTPLFQHTRAWQVLDACVAFIMWTIAIALVRNAL